MKNPKVSIIIVNWNGKKWLENCLSSVYKQSYKNFEVYFVDNGSIDKSSDFVRKKFPGVKIIQLSKNTGFAEGNNIGIREAFKDKQVKYIVCLNNDTIVDKNWLNELIKTAENNQNVGAVGSIALHSNEKIQTAGIQIRKDLLLSEDWLGQMSLGHNQNKIAFKEELPIFAPSGVSALYPKKVLIDVGLFDKDFFAYCEDIDLGFRITGAGYSCFLSPKSNLIHFHSGTGIIASPFKAYYSKRNSYFVAIKNYNLFDLFLFPFRDLSWNIKSFFSKKSGSSVNKFKVKNGNSKLLIIMLKVYFSVLVNLPKMLIKRYRYKKQ